MIDKTAQCGAMRRSIKRIFSSSLRDASTENAQPKQRMVLAKCLSGESGCCAFAVCSSDCDGGEVFGKFAEEFKIIENKSRMLVVVFSMIESELYFDALVCRCRVDHNVAAVSLVGAVTDNDLHALGLQCVCQFALCTINTDEIGVSEIQEEMRNS